MTGHRATVTLLVEIEAADDEELAQLMEEVVDRAATGVSSAGTFYLVSEAAVLND